MGKYTFDGVQFFKKSQPVQSKRTFSLNTYADIYIYILR